MLARMNVKHNPPAIENRFGVRNGLSEKRRKVEWKAEWTDLLLVLLRIEMQRRAVLGVFRCY